MEIEAQPPAVTESESLRPGSQRPKWLSAVTISAIVMGCLFGCCGIVGIGGLAVSRVIDPAAMQPPTGNAQIADAQKRYVERTVAFNAEIFPLSLGSGLLALMHAAALAIAGVVAHRVRPIGRRMLAALCLAGIAVEAVSGYIGLYVASEQNAVMAPLLDELVQSTKDEKQSQTEEQRRALEVTRKFMATGFKAGNVLSWLTVIGFFFVKASYYLACALYLRRPAVIAYFEPPPQPSEPAVAG